MRLATQKELLENIRDEYGNKLSAYYDNVDKNSPDNVFPGQIGQLCYEMVVQGFDKGAEEMATLKDVQIEGLVTTLQGAKWELELAGKYEAGQSIKKALENFRSAAEGSASFRKEGSNDPEVK